MDNPNPNLPPELQAELDRLKAERQREKEARAKSYDMHGGDHRSPMEAPMPTIIAQFGEWAVTPFGVECLTAAYQIQWDSLLDPVTPDTFWLEKLYHKDFVHHLHDLAEAIRIGRQIHQYLQGLPKNDAP
ncbi:MAG: hypothetical protein ACFE0Q_11185 [Anaerolineae bacterium]